MDGWMDGWMGWMDGWDGWMDGMDVWDGWDGWMGWMGWDGWMGWMYGMDDGWDRMGWDGMDGWNGVDGMGWTKQLKTYIESKFKHSTGHTMIAPEEQAITRMAMNMGIVNTEKRIDTQACSKHSQHIYATYGLHIRSLLLYCISALIRRIRAETMSYKINSYYEWKGTGNAKQQFGAMASITNENVECNRLELVIRQ
ncbi:hypothetical protein C0J52_26204 [Blattella germanica]|nr:hypothetical protein C0J52_26204 [Blattella germanica]